MYLNILHQRRSLPLLLTPPTALLSTDDDKPPPPPSTDQEPAPTQTQIWELPPTQNPSGTRPHYKPHPRPSLLPAAGTTTTTTSPEEDAEKWRVPTILVLTFSITLGVAMMFFLLWVVYRRIKKMQRERSREARERQEMVMRI